MKISSTLLTLTLLVSFASLSAQQGTLKISSDNDNSSHQLNSSSDDFTEAFLYGSGEEDLPELIQSTTPGSDKTSACAAAFIMNSPYNQNNGQRGIMFDVRAENDVTIRCFEANLYDGTTANYEIYYRPGTHVGHENNAAAWTFIGGATGITSAGNNLPTPLPIQVNVSIPAGQTYSFYITNDFGGGTNYTDGTAVGNFLAADGNLTVFEGVGKSYPFGLTFTVRNFNGHIFYDSGLQFPVEGMELSARPEAGQILLKWNTLKEINNSGFEVLRSVNGSDFDQVGWVAGMGDSEEEISYSFIDREINIGTDYYYQLRQVDLNGDTELSNIIKTRSLGNESFSVGAALSFTCGKPAYYSGLCSKGKPC